MNCLRWFCLSVLLLALSACLSDQELQRVRLNSFPSYGKSSGFYLAQERDYFLEQGIELEILDSFENILAPLETGDVEVAQAACYQALQAIEQGANYTIVGVRDAILPVGTISLPESSIETPSDYHGKRWGESAEFGMELALLPILAQSTGFDPNQVELVNLDFQVRLPALLRGDVDFISAWWGSGYPAQLLAAHEQGVDLHLIRWSDYGLDIYGNCLVARQEWLNDYPEVAKGFLAASVKGFEEAIVDPDAAVEAVIARNPSESEQRELVALAWAQAQDLLWDEYTRQHGMFSIDEVKLARTQELILGPAIRVPIQQTYTNEFLPDR